MKKQKNTLKNVNKKLDAIRKKQDKLRAEEKPLVNAIVLNAAAEAEAAVAAMARKPMSAERTVTEFENVWEGTSTWARLLLLDPYDKLTTWQLKERKVEVENEMEWEIVTATEGFIQMEHATNVAILNGKMGEGYTPIGIVGVGYRTTRRYVDCGHRPAIEAQRMMDAFQEGWDVCEWLMETKMG